MMIVVDVYMPVMNSGFLKKNNCGKISLFRGRWEFNGISHPLVFEKKICFSNKNVYWLPYFGIKSSNGGFHISLNFIQNQQFLLMQGNHWIQQKKKYRIIDCSYINWSSMDQ